MKSPKPTLLQGAMVMMMSAGMANHVFILPALLRATGRDAWMCIICTAPIMLLLLLTMHFIAKKLGDEPLIHWISRHAGRTVSVVFQVMLTLYAVVNIFSTMYETMLWVRINFLLNTPMGITSLFLMLVCYRASSKGLRAIANTAGILLPLVCLFGFTIASINLKYKDYNQLLPMLEHGIWPVINGMVYVMAGAFELILFLILQSGLRSRINLKTLLILGFSVLFITFGPVIGAIAEFNPYEAIHQRFPAYEEWRLATVGKFLSQTDFLSIFQWLAGSFLRICFLLYVTVEMWQIKTERQKNTALLFICVVLVLIGLAPISDVYMHQYTGEWLYPSNLVLLSLAAAGLAVIAAKAGRSGDTRGQSGQQPGQPRQQQPKQRKLRKPRVHGSGG
ncbi:endospore germination permease [Paenibacillus sp. YN15]|uniref:GerAB/ArcD/ProY family transporter n=1 Tax=Paenibacillus sp. YN15 TaxID=1742774 RepID=UPI0015EC3251|nr:endospore germination permease [Paenibacillus sp. YN15]